MKKQTVFIDLNGTIGNYVNTIFTDSQTSDTKIRGLQALLNSTIKHSNALPANAANLKQFWENLTEAIKNVNEEINKEDKAYQELIAAVDKIGYSIAYLCKRTNNGWKKRPITMYPDYTDEDILKAIKIMILNCYNDGTFQKHSDGTYTCTSDGKTVVLDDYITMTDEELLEEGKACKVWQANRLAKATGFKVSMDQKITRTYQELIYEADRLYNIISMIKSDRIPVLEGDNEHNKEKLKCYIESGRADDWETMDLEQVKRTLADFEQQYKRIKAELFVVSAINAA